MKIFPAFFSLLFFVSCNLTGESPVTYTTYLIEPGDLVVTNGGTGSNKSVVLLDENGNYKATLLDLLASDSPMGISFNTSTKELIISVDSTADRVIAISVYSGATRDFINDIANLTGNLYGITQLPDGDFIIAETSTLERYSATGNRVTSGSWPKTGGVIMTNLSELNALPDGNFLACSSGTDQARLYSNTGTQVSTSGASGIATTTDVFGCSSLADGTFAIGWNGTTDTIQIRASNLTTINASFSNTTVLGNPRGMAQKSNGNIVIVDQSNNHIVEITTAGVLVDTYGDALSIPVDIFVIPDFY
jgi:hypothetical protein